MLSSPLIVTLLGLLAVPPEPPAERRVREAIGHGLAYLQVD